MPTKGKISKSKKNVLPNSSEEEKEVQEPEKNQSSQSKATKKSHKSVDEDDELYDQDVSDDSDINAYEVPWAKQKNTNSSLDTILEPISPSSNRASKISIAKKGRAKDTDMDEEKVNSTELSEQGKLKNLKTLPSPDKTSNNVIPKKKRDFQENVTESSVLTIPKKKREMEDSSADVASDSILLKTNEAKTIERLISSTEQNSSTSTLVTSGKPPILIEPLPPIATTGQSKRPPPNTDSSKGSTYHMHFIENPSLPRTTHSNPNNVELPTQPTSSLVNDQTEDLRKDINRLIDIVYKDKDRKRAAPLETVDMFGSFLSKSFPESFDFFDRDEKGAIIHQPKIPIFPEDLAQGQKPFPLSWWGIVTPPEKILKYHYPPPPSSSAPAQPQLDPLGDSVTNAMNPPRHPIIHNDRRHGGTMLYDPTQFERDHTGPLQRHYHPNAFPPGHPPGWDQYPTSYVGPPMYNRPNRFGPDWQMNMRDDRRNNNTMDRPHR